MKRFRISFEVNEPLLTTVISVLSGHTSALSIVEVEKPSVVRITSGSPRDGERMAPPPSPNSRSWVTAKDYLGSIPVGTIFSKVELGAYFVKNSLNEQTASPMITHLRRAGLILPVSHGKYKKV